MSSELGLNAAPSTATFIPPKDPPTSSAARSTMRARRRILIASTSLRNDSAWSTPSSPARAMSPDVLGQAPTAETETGVQEAPTDPVVVRQRLGQRDHVRPGRLANLGHGVDEADLRGEEGVGGHLDQLGGGGGDPAAGLRLGHLGRDAGGPVSYTHLT